MNSDASQHELTPGDVTVDQLYQLFLHPQSITLAPECRAAVDHAQQVVLGASLGNDPVYGVNTGFGKLSSIKIEPENTQLLQRNLVLSHCSGVGDESPDELVRMMMLLKILSLARGASGVRWILLELLLAMYNSHIVPVIPAQGSVGASGDLAPLAHLAAVMLGEGEATVEGRRMSGAEALASVELQPLKLEAKEGLALINGTQFSCAHALIALFNTNVLATSGVITAAMTTDAIMGSTAPLRTEIHQLRGHRGQIAVASTMRNVMQGSEIRESHREEDTRVQDPYCIRCQPQVAGACLDLLKQAMNTLVIESNAVTDNPLVASASGEILSGGNFHAEPVAFAADQIALAIAELGSIAQRRIALMVDPALSFDLPPFLTPDPGLNSGYMVAEITSAALMSENKHLANPCSTDSTPTSANQEDHVSMAAHGARRLHQMNRNLSRILSIELLCAAQGIEFRAPLKTSAHLATAISALRQFVPSLEADRALSADIEQAAGFLQRGGLLDACGIDVLAI